MSRLRGLDLGAIVFGLIVLGVGGYYLLVNTFGLDLPELDWDKIWPLLVIALGLAIVLGAWGRMGRGGHGPQSV
jgi:LiaI-LiaF-like transmembrane region